MLRVLIERPPTVEEDVVRSKADYTTVAKRYPDTARQMRVSFCGTDEERERMLARAEVFVGWVFPTTHLARRAPHLKWIQLTGAGVEHLRPFDWMPPGLKLSNCSGVHGPKVAEFATMALLMLNSHMPHLVTQQRAHRWYRSASSLIAGRTVVVAGRHGRSRRRCGQAARPQGHRRQSLRPAESFLRTHPAGGPPP
jgi:phosphoglycerate dehydrogenase-like enzyme